MSIFLFPAIQKKGLVLIQILFDESHTCTGREDICRDAAQVIIDAMNKYHDALGIQSEVRDLSFLYLNSYLLTLEAISRACSGHPKGRLSFGSLSLWKILAMIIAEGLLNVASKIKNRP